MSSSPLTVYIDFKSPYAFVAKDPTWWLEELYDIEINWQPLTLNIQSYLGSARKDNSGKLVENNRSATQWLAVKYAYMDARRYASLRGLTLKGTQKIWDSSLAAIGLMWLADQDRQVRRRYIDSVYTQFWQRALDIEDNLVITAELQKAGAELTGFEDFLVGDGRRSHDRLQDKLLDDGLIGVPTYVIDGEAYFGRENLPRVRWHLEGCKGAFPDVAYDSRMSGSMG